MGSCPPNKYVLESKCQSDAHCSRFLDCTQEEAKESILRAWYQGDIYRQNNIILHGVTSITLIKRWTNKSLLGTDSRTKNAVLLILSKWGGECPAQIFGTFPECLVDGGELRSPPELNNVVGERHQLPLEGRGQGSLLLPWEGEQVAVVEPEPQKVVLGYIATKTLNFTNQTTKPHQVWGCLCPGC